MKTQYLVSLIAIIPIVAFLIARKFYPRARLIENNKATFHALVYAFILGWLGWHFYTRGIVMGVVAVGLGGLAITKYLLDMAKQEKEE